MRTTDLKLLIISYYFPPYHRVGGRRWAKHAKYLFRMGIKTHVLAGEFLNSTSSWDNDTLEYDKYITRVPLKKSYIPYFKRVLPKGFFNKIKWKLSLYTWDLRKVFLKGNYMDVSLNTINDFYFATKKIILENDINTVLLSVGPYRYSETLVLLKKKFPNIKYIIDYRDRWEDGLEGLTRSQQNYENIKQIETLKAVDLVVTVNDYIGKKITELELHRKTYTLPHCVDDDFYHLNDNEPKKNSDIKFIYGGELYNGLENELRTFLTFMKLFESKVKNKCTGDFYITYPAYETIFKDNPSIKSYSFLGIKDYQQKLSEADFILLFRPEWSLDSFSSKFFELLCLRKPILYFGKGGIVSDFLLTKKMGFHITNYNINEIVELVYRNTESKEIPDLKYDISTHSFEYQTKLFIGELEKL